MDIRSKIAQIIVDMHVMQKHDIRRQEMVPIIKEVNNSQMIGHALRFKYDEDGKALYIQKYRRTNVEKKVYHEPNEALQ